MLNVNRIAPHVRLPPHTLNTFKSNLCLFKSKRGLLRSCFFLTKYKNSRPMKTNIIIFRFILLFVNIFMGDIYWMVYVDFLDILRDDPV